MANKAEQIAFDVLHVDNLGNSTKLSTPSFLKLTNSIAESFRIHRNDGTYSGMLITNITLGDNQIGDVYRHNCIFNFGHYGMWVRELLLKAGFLPSIDTKRTVHVSICGDDVVINELGALGELNARRLKKNQDADNLSMFLGLLWSLNYLSLNPFEPTAHWFASPDISNIHTYLLMALDGNLKDLSRDDALTGIRAFYIRHPDWVSNTPDISSLYEASNVDFNQILHNKNSLILFKDLLMVMSENHRQQMLQYIETQTTRGFVEINRFLTHAQ